jgi:hypothetical protein
MADFNARPESLNVEQIMDQIRARIREKRGVDYEEQQIQELAKAKLDQLLDPRSVQTDLLDRLKKLQPSFEAPQLPSYEFEDTTLFESTRGPLRTIRRLLNPILKLFFNPNPLIGALHTQAKLNAMYADREAKRDAMRLAGDQLHYQILHNLLLEMTRATLEVKNLRMRVESIGSRLEFNERRTRGLESAAFPMGSDRSSERSDRPDRSDRSERSDRPDRSDRSERSDRQDRSDRPPPRTPPPAPPAAQPAGSIGSAAAAPAPSPTLPQGTGQPGDGAASRSRRRRRRRGRRGGGQPGPGAPPPSSDTAAAADAPPAKDDLDNFGGAESHPSEAELPSSAPDADGDDDPQ